MTAFFSVFSRFFAALDFFLVDLVSPSARAALPSFSICASQVVAVSLTRDAVAARFGYKMAAFKTIGNAFHTLFDVRRPPANDSLLGAHP